MEEEYLNVSQVNRYIKTKLNKDGKLRNILVRGEISNYKSYTHGHDYFTLKDEKTQLDGVLYKASKRFLEFELKDGMKVIVKGTIEVYEKQGKYQLKANRIKKDGIGASKIAFEKLKEKLNSEGLFDEEFKKEIPKFPKRIGVVTAKNGAAIKDIITTIKRRYPQCEIFVFSTLVQGENASPQIAEQIRKSENYDLDTLIIGRGGGSYEDLWPFNEEIVARAIFECNIPTISAVGHEIDHTIADLVADKRAATPTAAAELAVPEINELNYKINQLNKRANKFIKNKILENKNKLKNITNKQIIKNPESIYDIKQMHLDHLINNISNSSKNIITSNRHRLIIAENSNVFKNPKCIYEEKELKLDNIINNISFSSKNIISINKNRLTVIKNSNALKNPEKIYADRQPKIDNQFNKLNFTFKHIISDNKNKLEQIKKSKTLKNPLEIKNKKENEFNTTVDKLNILNPLLTLKRGYSMAKKDDKVITSVEDVKKGDELDIELKDGTINTKVI